MANLTKFGSVGIAKKMFGSKEVLKEVFNGSVIYEKVTTVPYITFSSPNSFTLATYNRSKGWNGSLYYSTNKSTWNTWSGTTTLSSASDGTNHNLYLRGTNNTYMNTTLAGVNGRWELTGSNISCSGNIENLLDYEVVAKTKNPELNGHPTMTSYCYYYMFYRCTSLTTAPELPATTSLPGYCYSNMFRECTSLVTAPTLPATTFYGGSCYVRMFQDCTSLTTAPALPATTLPGLCYAYMFTGCTSLTTAPALPATAVANQCYQGMFQDCTSLTTLPELPATTLKNFCYQNMFNGCTKIKLSTNQTGEYQTPYRIPTSGTGSGEGNASSMFSNTGGTFTGTPSINQTYYTSNTVI